MIGEAIAGRPRRGLPGLEGPPARTRRGTGRSRPASGRSRASEPTGWTATSCTGAVDYPLEDTIAAFEQLRRDGQDPVLGREQLRRGRPRGGPGGSPARAASPATRSSTICRSARSSTPCSPGAKSTASPWSATARSVTGASPARAPQGGRVLRGDRRRPRGDPAPGRAPVPGAAALALRDPEGLAARSTRRRTRERGDLHLTDREVAMIARTFPRGPRRDLPVL